MRFRVLSLLFTLFSFTGQAQFILDTCFSSISVGPSFLSSGDLMNFTSSDLMTWDGANWMGNLPNANVTLPPPSGNIDCKAIFLGNGQTWSSGGEGFAIKLSTPLTTGQVFSFPLTYVSHGNGSDGNFSPLFFTGNPSLTAVNLIGNLPSAGNSWVTNTIAFTVSPSQNGDTWLIFRTGNGSTGLVSSFCQSCTTPAICSVELGPEIKICSNDTLILNPVATPGTLTWQDGSTGPTHIVTEPGLYQVTLSYGSCVAKDSIQVSLFTSTDAISAGKDCACNLYIPNSFTPDNNEFNNTLGAVLNCETNIFEFTIFNRWGQTIFKSNDPNVYWDGTLFNQPVPIGLYIYTVKYQFAKDAEIKFQTGHLNKL